MTCVHCPAAAIVRDGETDAVVIDPARCIGSKMCMLTCPFGTIHFDSQGKVCIKCYLRGSDPQGVKHCISGALTFSDEEGLLRRDRGCYNGQMAALLGVELAHVD